MIRNVKMNLGGRAFDMDEDAVQRLEAYLKALKRHFQDDPSGREIINDIEMRLSELLDEMRYGTKIVITLRDVEEAIALMGYPDDFDDEEETYRQKRVVEVRRPKRLYRDPDNHVLAGVCGGLGAYWNIDPVALRVLALVLLIFWGVTFWAYLILWIAVPKAVTLSQKLEMRGEVITIEGIKNNVKSEYRDIRDRWKHTR